ncbi:MAG: gluconeogenesis factor YvcK family protein [bacterium]
MKQIVVIGGGTGTFTVLTGLREYACDLSAIVSTADNGGSTGVLRDELGILPPGDIRQALVALSDDATIMRELLSYRFEEGGLKGHTFGNLLLGALEKLTGSFDQAVLEAGHILRVQGSVIPVTTDKVHLMAETVQGKTVKGQHDIDEHIWAERAGIQRLWLEPECEIHPLARQAILKADLVVLAPGSLYTSLIPNLLVKGMREALATTKAPLVYVANLMTEKGQAGAFYVQDFVEALVPYLGEGEIDYVVYNTRVPSAHLLERYKKEMERMPVRLDRRRKDGLSYQLIGTPLLNTRPVTSVSKADPLQRQRTLIRHHPAKLAEVLQAVVHFKDAKKYLS